MLALGIDIGGSGIKGAIVDTETGNLVSDRVRIPTPQPSNADAVVATVRQLINELRFENGPVGIGFPGVIRANTIYTAANLEKCLIGVNLEKRLSGMNLGPVRVINDADAAGFAEMEFEEFNVFGLMRRNASEKASIRRFENILYPNGWVEYNFFADQYSRYLNQKNNSFLKCNLCVSKFFL